MIPQDITTRGEGMQGVEMEQDRLFAAGSSGTKRPTSAESTVDYGYRLPSWVTTMREERL
jgi:hypothetical protein